jgi:hypothetical protein
VAREEQIGGRQPSRERGKVADLIVDDVAIQLIRLHFLLRRPLKRPKRKRHAVLRRQPIDWPD